MKLEYILSDAYAVKSPPSRGAWIEIIGSCFMCKHARSPPSRGAWIEIKPLNLRE